MYDIIFSWNTLWWLMVALYVPSCFGLIIIVLLQKGKGAGFAGAFGVGPGSDTVFGPRMAKSLPQRMTYIMAGVFMSFALIMSMLSGRLARGAAPELEAEMGTSEQAFESLFEKEAEEDTEDETGMDGMVETPGQPNVSVTPVPEDAPAEDAPAEDAPAEDAPAEDAPAEDAPAEDA
ncbi:MAG: preprotein translocase subunit SecG, partial [Candidatus Hydrogenedentota bacterium]